MGWLLDSLFSPQKSDLIIRTMSTLVLAPIALGVFSMGSPWGGIFIFLVAVLSAWEWASLVCHADLGRTAPGRNAYAMLVVVLLTVFFWVVGLQRLSISVLVFGVLLQTGLSKGRNREKSLWYRIGAVYISLSFLAFSWLRGDDAQGLALVLWIFAVVWSTDIGAYLVGRQVGGPKLISRVSPNKTWAGLVGGSVFAAFASFLVGSYLKIGYDVRSLSIIGVLLAVVAQAGDLFESYVKRLGGKKDSGRIIPGHGGILDRIDGLMAVGIVVAASRILEEL